jgi:UDP-2,3-diacylglucosamine pyrophosphatase LpxH
MKRKMKIAVISDTHIGIYGCQAKLLLCYLKSIDPEILILNGDIIDIWNYSRFSFSKSQIKVIRQLIKLIESAKMTYYITGNHDELLRKYSGLKFGKLNLVDHLILNIDGKKTWFFHGDVFDATTKGWAKMIAKLGGRGYDFLIMINRLTNDILHFFGKEKISMSNRIKASVKKAVLWINNFESTAAVLAIDQKFDTVVCGHIHQPQMYAYYNENGEVLYLNSGDWLEHCTALEYYDGKWHLFTQVDISDSESVHIFDDDSYFDVHKTAFYQRFYDHVVEEEFSIIES